MGFQSAQQVPTGNLTKAPVGLTPIPKFAEVMGNMTPSADSLLLNQLPDEISKRVRRKESHVSRI
jgi:hypothetical protein